MSVSFQVVIPARLGSTRLPEKPLADLGGEPLIVRVWERAMKAGAERVIVAADHDRIVGAVEKVGGVGLLTRTSHRSGTDRLAEVAEIEGWSDETIVVNLQGDEPLLPTELPARLAAALADHPTAGIATMAVRIDEATELFSPNAVKTVLDDEGYALLFSRAPIPWVRDVFTDGPPGELPTGVPFLRHVGLYAYRVGTLREIAGAPPAAIERAESLEQLRAMAMGIRIHVTVLEQAPPPGVDTPDDLTAARAHFATPVR